MDNLNLNFLKDIDIKSYEYPWDDVEWKTELEVSVLKIWTDGKPRGFTAYRFMSVGSVLGTEEEIKGVVIHILKLAIHPEWRNKGIGTELLKNIEAAAKHQEVDFLVKILHEENKDGRDWLLKKDFVGFSVLKNIFPQARDGFSFIKRVER